MLKADCIVVINEGTIEDIGVHAELLKRNSLYARMVQLQFGGEPDTQLESVGSA